MNYDVAVTTGTSVAELKTKFYTLRQNNSGGKFDLDKEYGISIYVIVEGLDIDHINGRVDRILSYPSRGYDCPCCGMRWDTDIWEDELDDVPSIYGRPAKEYMAQERQYFGTDGERVCIHYIDGRKEWF